jgi:hypothetical protein
VSGAWYLVSCPHQAHPTLHKCKSPSSMLAWIGKGSTVPSPGGQTLPALILMSIQDPARFLSPLYLKVPLVTFTYLRCPSALSRALTQCRGQGLPYLSCLPVLAHLASLHWSYLHLSCLYWSCLHLSYLQWTCHT